MIQNKTIKYAALYSLPASALISFGFTFDRTGDGLSITFKRLVATAALSITLFILYILFRAFLKKLNTQSISSKKGVFRNTFLTIVLLWTPYYLACYPGLYVYDAIVQTHYSIMLNVVNSFHPLIHTYLMTFFIKLGQVLFGSSETGFALYTLFQMLYCACVLAYIATELYKYSASKLLFIVAILLFGLFPVFPILAISATKDTIFSITFALSGLQLLKFTINTKDITSSKSQLALTFLSLLITSLFRNNGLYAVVLVLIILAITLLRNNNWNTSILAIGTLAMTLFLGLVFPKFISVGGGSSIAEMLGIPIQQIGRTLTTYPADSLNGERDNAIGYVPGWKNYNQYIADELKFYADTSDRISRDPKGFIETWIQIGLQKPRCYLNAAIAMTEGYWNPFFHYNSNEMLKAYLSFNHWYISEDKALLCDEHLSLPAYVQIQNAKEWLVIERNSFLPKLEKMIERIAYFPPWTETGITNALFSTGTILLMFWMLIVMSFENKNSSALFLILLNLTYLATVLLGPVYQIRYAFPFTCSFVVLIIAALFVNKDNGYAGKTNCKMSN